MAFRDPPPSSTRGTFPLVIRSTVMQAFFDRIASAAQPSRVVPLEVGRNMLEFRALMQHLKLRLEISDDEYQAPSGRSQSFMNIIDDQPELLVYPKGEQIPPHVQASFAGGLLKHTRIIACLSKPVADLARLSAGDCARVWQEGFVKLATKPIVFPKWHERHEDQHTLIMEMYQRLTMPHGRKRPELGEDALRSLLVVPADGTDEIEERLKSAWSMYIGNHSKGPLTEKFILGSQTRRALESRGDLPSS